MTVVDNFKSKTVIEEIMKNIAPEAVVKTDGCKSFLTLSGNKYDHKVLENIMKWIHIVIFNAKTRIQGSFHGACGKHMQKYLDEYCYRFNRRFWEGQIFNRLLTACASSNTITYAELSG
jgi:transposase-like protein